MEMFTDMATLGANQHSLSSIMRYMIACFNYKIRDIVIGSHPYPDHIVPHYGSAYSQQYNTNDTPTTEIIGQHFSDSPELRSDILSCIRGSWKTIACGCIWLNASYANSLTDTHSAVMANKRLRYMIEFICVLLQEQTESYKTMSFTFLTMGQQGLFVASSVSQRLRCHNIRCTIVQSGQPAQLSRITYNEDLIGVHSNYTCITQSAKTQLMRIARSYRSAQGTRESDIKCTMNKSVKAIVESSMKEILLRCNALGSEFDKLQTLEEDVSNVNGVPEIDQLFLLVKGIKRICLQQQALITDLTECILTSAYIRATIQDSVITSLDASVKPINTVPVNAIVSSTPDSAALSSRRGSSVASMSAVTAPFSLDDIMTPRRPVRTSTADSSTPSQPIGKSVVVKSENNHERKLIHSNLGKITAYDSTDPDPFASFS